MSMPAGWYDDGSGRQRWWDGARWTEQFAPDAVGVVSPVSAPVARVAPVLGFVGLALAVLGTILACIPATFVVGVVVLIAGFVVSLIGVFKKNAAKWPSIVGIILSIVGGAIGTVVVLVALAANLAEPIGPPVPPGTPSSNSTAQPTPSSTADSSAERPAAQIIGDAVLRDLQRSGFSNYDDNPEFISCMGQYLYDSALSDEALSEYVESLEVPQPEAELSERISQDGTVFCGAN